MNRLLAIEQLANEAFWLMNGQEKKIKQLQSIVDSMYATGKQDAMRIRELAKNNEQLLKQQTQLTTRLEQVNNQIKPAIKRETPVWLKVVERVLWFGGGVCVGLKIR